MPIIFVGSSSRIPDRSGGLQPMTQCGGVSEKRGMTSPHLAHSGDMRVIPISRQGPWALPGQPSAERAVSVRDITGERVCGSNGAPPSLSRVSSLRPWSSHHFGVGRLIAVLWPRPNLGGYSLAVLGRSPIVEASAAWVVSFRATLDRLLARPQRRICDPPRRDILKIDSSCTSRTDPL